ncbi:MAG: ATPase, T2SS/T4P/T4SS family [Candidatus Tyrphobacter sp.]
MPEIFFVIGSKGGVGATTFATHVATTFAKDGGPTLLVDGDLSGRRAGAVLFNAIAKVDARRAQDDFALAEVGPNLTLFELAGSIHDGFTIKPDKVEQLLRSISAATKFAIVDAAQPFAAAVRPFAVRAAQFLLVVEPSMLGVTGARVMQLELMKFGVPESRLSAVVVARDPHNRVPTAEIERALKLKIMGEIPPLDDKKFEKAVAAVVDRLKSGPQPADLLVLQPSTSTPIGERRMVDRTKVDVSNNGVQKRAADTASDQHKNKWSALKAEIHRELSRRIDFAAIGSNADPLRLEELRAEVESTVTEAVARHPGLGSAEEIARLRQDIIHESLGLGPLEDLMSDPEVTEIMVNGPDRIYVERRGRIELSGMRFNDQHQVRLVIERIISPIGRHIDEAVPMVDARLPDGSRVNATVEPLSIDYPTITIRRFAKDRLKADDLVSKGSLTPEMADLLRAAVEARLNIVISGGTGSGKTTLLNVLSGFIPVNERIITIEDAAELQLHQDHVVRMEARPANVEGRGAIPIRELVRNSLRMRPDRIVVGECRGGEALDMLQAMNTGHDGSLTTVHANTPRDCLSRIETMVLMAGFDIPVRAIREQVSGAVDVIVQTSRLRDGSRKVTSVTEVVGMEGDIISTQEILRFDQHGLDKEGKLVGSFVYTGVQPNFLRRLEEYGVSFQIERLSQMQLAVAAW